MKPAILSILQQRMDKCTSEQNWMVAILLAINGSIAAKTDLIPAKIPHALALSVTLVLSLYGVLYCLERHCSYYRNRKAFAELIEGQTDLPNFLSSCPRLCTFRTVMGIGVQIVFIVGSWLVSAMALLGRCA